MGLHNLILPDANHGLGRYGLGKAWNGYEPDGPVIFGYNGGALGTTNGGAQAVLAWGASGRVGIGTTAPAERLEVAGNLRLSGPGNALIFPDSTTQTTAATDQQQLSLSGSTLSLSIGRG
jgi:hypothetical protein